MKYETPEVMASVPAINAIEAHPKIGPPPPDSEPFEEQVAYEDWE